MALCRGVRREWLVGRCSSISNTVVRARVSSRLGKPYSSLSSFVSVVCEVGFEVPFSVAVLSVRVFCTGFRAFFFARFSARVFALCVVVAVGVCRAFIGLILVLQSVGRIFTVALQSCCSLVAVLSQVCYCRVTVTHRVTGVLLSHYRPPSCYRCVVVVLPLCYRPIALSLCYCRVTVALLSRYCRVTVALLSCYRCVTIVLSLRYYRVIVALL